MSFSLTIKEELCQVPLAQQSDACLLAEAFGVLLFCNTFSSKEIRISTSCTAFAQRLPPLFQQGFDLDFDSVPQGENPRQKYLFTLDSPEKMAKLFQKLGYPQDVIACHLNFAMVEEPGCLEAFVRGAFLAGGSCSDPEKSYHLEMSTCHGAVSRELSALLHETAFPPKITQRKGHFICYYKKKELIHGFLKAFSAEKSAEELLRIADKKHITSSVNRQLNCDNANLEKTVNTAQEQIKIIKMLDEQGILSTLPDKLQETAQLRIENPDCTLSQLAEFFTPPISKSALNHRLRKLCALAENKE